MGGVATPKKCKHGFSSDVNYKEITEEINYRFRKHNVLFHFTKAPIDINTIFKGVSLKDILKGNNDVELQLNKDKATISKAVSDMRVHGNMVLNTFLSGFKEYAGSKCACDKNPNNPGTHCVGGPTTKQKIQCLKILLIPHWTAHNNAPNYNGFAQENRYVCTLANCHKNNSTPGTTSAHELGHCMGQNHEKNTKDLMASPPVSRIVPEKNPDGTIKKDAQGQFIRDQEKTEKAIKEDILKPIFGANNPINNKTIDIRKTEVYGFLKKEGVKQNTTQWDLVSKKIIEYKSKKKRNADINARLKEIDAELETLKNKPKTAANTSKINELNAEADKLTDESFDLDEEIPTLEKSIAEEANKLRLPADLAVSD